VDAARDAGLDGGLIAPVALGDGFAAAALEAGLVAVAESGFAYDVDR